MEMEERQGGRRRTCSFGHARYWPKTTRDPALPIFQEEGRALPLLMKAIRGI